jgi:hypothetical protein
MAACTARNRNGSACQARALVRSTLCFFHDTATATSNNRRDAQQRGGQNSRSQLRRDYPPTQPFRLSEPRELLRLIEFAVNGLVEKKIDHRDSHALGYLSDCAMRAYQLVEQTATLERLEQLQRAGQCLLAYEADDDKTIFEEAVGETHRS